MNIMTEINWDLMEKLLEGLTDDQIFEVMEEMGSWVTKPEVWEKVKVLAEECLE